MRQHLVFVGYLELGPDKYLQIQIFGIGEEQTTLDRFLEDILFQGSFHIACEKNNKIFYSGESLCYTMGNVYGTVFCVKREFIGERLYGKIYT